MDFSNLSYAKLVERYEEENRDTLVNWCRTYTEEVEGYIDTFDTLLDVESYDVIRSSVL